MAITAETKDCTALSDSELSEMADTCADGPSKYEAGLLSKQAEEWVLVTLVREGRSLKGFSFCTLERIGGTPCIIMGCGSFKRTARRDAYLRAALSDQFRRAVLAFPDEDVLVAARVAQPGAYEAFRTLHDVVPRPGHTPTGEERAWGRRLAKRYGVDPKRFDDRRSLVSGDGTFPLVLDHETSRPERLPEGIGEVFSDVDPERGDSLIVFGWVMAEELAKIET